MRRDIERFARLLYIDFYIWEISFFQYVVFYSFAVACDACGWRVSKGAFPAEPVFDIPQGMKQVIGRQTGYQSGDGIYIIIACRIDRCSTIE